MESIVVGVDGSEGASRALAFAAHEAALRQAKLPIVCVSGIEPSAAAFPRLGGVIAEARSRAQRVCEDACAQAKQLEPAVACDVVVEEGQPATVLVDESRGAALLVVGSRGLGGFKGLLLGSVSQQCAQHASCPVMIVPRPHADG
jgi:nucleotide-binding universal stress UspA family protein